MGSVSNQNPWASYDTYRNCTQGFCSFYCPQNCYVVFPPPPFFPGDNQDDDDSGTDFSPLIIAIIGILASAFLLISYYILISKYCRRRGNGDRGIDFNDYHDQTNAESWQGASVGLDEALIKSITVCKYKKGDGLVEGTDCSVCLSEFQEDESLRLLPKCNHAFHLPCIDTWLRSNSSCPLCRSNIATADSLPPQPVNAVQEAHPDVHVSTHQLRHRNDDVLVIQDVERSVCQEGIVSITEDVHTKTTPSQDFRNLEEGGNMTEADNIQPVRRSISMNSSCHGRVSVADILHVSDDDGEIQAENSHVSIEIESSRHPGEEDGKVDDRKEVLHLVRNPSAIKRSISTGRFMFTRYAKGKNHVIPH